MHWMVKSPYRLKEIERVLVTDYNELGCIRMMFVEFFYLEGSPNTLDRLSRSILITVALLFSSVLELVMEYIAICYTGT